MVTERVKHIVMEMVHTLQAHFPRRLSILRRWNCVFCCFASWRCETWSWSVHCQLGFYNLVYFYSKASAHVCMLLYNHMARYKYTMPISSNTMVSCRTNVLCLHATYPVSPNGIGARKAKLHTMHVLLWMWGVIDRLLSSRSVYGRPVAPH